MQRLVILFIFFLFYSCDQKYQAKEKEPKSVESKTQIINSVKYSVKLIDEKLVVKNADSMVVYNSGNLIRNFDLLNTTLYNGLSNDFFLVYQNNAGNLKTQASFHFYCEENELFLISKEEIDFNGKNIVLSRNYIAPINVSTLNYEAIDEKLNTNQTGSSLISQNKLKELVLYNSKNAFEIVFDYNMEDFFTDYPVDLYKIGKINFLNIKNSNDIAYYLQQAQIYNEAICLLENIIQKEPTRVVAYLNLADSYWEINENKKAKKTYQNYIRLMKAQSKDVNKIPLRVYDRIK